MRLNLPDYEQLSTWRPEDLPVGNVAEAGASEKYVTGGWRTMRPVWDQEACKNCMLCWIVCPDVSILVNDQVMTGIDYDHCKGCGICVHECKFNALHRVAEDQAKED